MGSEHHALSIAFAYRGLPDSPPSRLASRSLIYYPSTNEGEDAMSFPFFVSHLEYCTWNGTAPSRPFELYT